MVDNEVGGMRTSWAITDNIFWGKIDDPNAENRLLCPAKGSLALLLVSKGKR